MRDLCSAGLVVMAAACAVSSDPDFEASAMPQAAEAETMLEATRRMDEGSERTTLRVTHVGVPASSR